MPANVTLPAHCGFRAILSILLGIALNSWATPAVADLSVREFSAYRASYPKVETFERAVAPVVEALSATRKRDELPDARSELASRWHISPNAEALGTERLFIATTIPVPNGSWLFQASHR